MSSNSLIALIVAVLVLSRFWRQLLPVILALLIAASVVGFDQIIHLLRY
jgi:hypothetical protein